MTTKPTGPFFVCCGACDGKEACDLCPECDRRYKALRRRYRCHGLGWSGKIVGPRADETPEE